MSRRSTPASEQLEPFLDLLAALDFAWIEAPFPLDNVEEHAKLRAATRIPVGVGDLALTTCREFEPFLAADAFDIAQPDLTNFGGFTEAQRLAQMLAGTGRRIVPHAYNTDITIAAKPAIPGRAVGARTCRVFDEPVAPAAGPGAWPRDDQRRRNDPGPDRPRPRRDVEFPTRSRNSRSVAPLKHPVDGEPDRQNDSAQHHRDEPDRRHHRRIAADHLAV